MKIKIRTCDVCGAEIPKQVECNLERYQVKIKRIHQYNSWGETDLPIREKVDLCPNCFTDLCKGVIIDKKPKHGRWIEESNGAVFCSECGTEWLSESAKYYNFCPNCGARMEASDD